MPTKKQKKYEQSIAAPQFAPAPVPGAFVQRLQELVSWLFGNAPQGPTVQEIIDYHLTQREREVGYLAALGFSDREIAESLGLTVQNVRQHLHNTLRKLDLENVSELRHYFSPRDW